MHPADSHRKSVFKISREKATEKHPVPVSNEENRHMVDG